MSNPKVTLGGLGATLAKVRDGLADVLAELGGWIAPVPTAYFTSQAGITLLHWPNWVAWLVAGTVELLGVSSIATWLSVRQWNVTHKDDDDKAPIGLASGVVGCYVVVIGALTVALKFRPEYAPYASLLLPVLSLAGMTTLALRAEHRRRLASVQLAPVAAEVEPQPAPVHQDEREDLAAFAPVVAQVTKRDAIRAYFLANEHDTNVHAAEVLGIDEKTVGYHRRALIKAQEIGANGTGVR